MKRLLLAALLVLLMGGGVWAGYETLFSQVKETSWAIYVRSTGGMNAVCSASAFRSDKDNTYLLSAGHCFLGNDLSRTDFLVTQNHRTFFKAELYKSGFKLRDKSKETSSNMDDYSGNDWAIVKAEVGMQAVLPIGVSSDLVLGEDLIMIGVPFGMDFLAVQGIVGSKDMSLSQLTWNHSYGANIYGAGGNSGTGVVSVKQKALVGIVVAGPSTQSSMMIFTPMDKVPAEWLGPKVR